jgi:hypothetical protein
MLLGWGFALLRLTQRALTSTSVGREEMGVAFLRHAASLLRQEEQSKGA